MLSRAESLKATKAAAQVLDDFAVRDAVLNGGFTRVDPIDLAEQAGLHVMCRPMEHLLGAFIRQEQPGILLNTQRSAGMIHMTCAHELGHYFLNHATTVDEHLDYGTGADSTSSRRTSSPTHWLRPLGCWRTLCARAVGRASCATRVWSTSSRCAWASAMRRRCGRLCARRG